MKKGTIALTLMAILIVLVSSSLYAGKKEIVTSSTKKAVQYLKVNGEAAFINAINNKDMFHDGEFYVWALKTNFKDSAVVVAHITPALRNKDFYNLRDAKGKLFIQEIVNTANKKESGWVSYLWTHPQTKKIQPKKAYFIRVNDIIVLNGFYE